MSYPAHGWVEAVDKRSGAIYYVNKITKTTSWDRPPELGPEPSAVPDAPDMSMFSGIPSAPDLASIPMAPPVPDAPPLQPYNASAPKSIGDILRSEKAVASTRKAGLNQVQKEEKAVDMDELTAAVMKRRAQLKNVPKIQPKDESNRGNPANNSELSNMVLQGIAGLRKVGARRPSFGEVKGRAPELDLDKMRDGTKPKWQPKKPQDMRGDAGGGDMAALNFRCGRCRQQISNIECADTQSGLFHVECFICECCTKGIMGEYLAVNDTFFHPDCLFCSTCSTSLIGQPLLCTTEKKLFCATHAPRDVCRGCSLKCEEGRVIQMDEMTWHEKCFNCAQCRKGLSGKKFLTHTDQQYYCKECYDEVAAPRCHRCHAAATGQVFKITPPGTDEEILLHKQCYTCAHCRTSLSGKGSYPLNGDLYCKDHYDLLKA